MTKIQKEIKLVNTDALWFGAFEIWILKLFGI
jgi:hypothetical protein